MVKKSAGSAKRFGPRYGKTLKNKLSIIEKEQKDKHKCRYCNYNKVKRVASGIWFCTKCGAKFTAKAYSPKVRKFFLKSGEEENLVDKDILLDEKELEDKKKEVDEDSEKEDKE